MNVDKIINRIFHSNTFVLRKEGFADVWLVDCGDIQEILNQLSAEEHIAGVLLTHGHSDHIYGLNELLAAFPDVKIYTNEYGQQEIHDSRLNYSHYHEDYDDIILQSWANVICLKSDSDGVDLQEGWLNAKVYHTPGHDDSCMTYVIGSYVFSGDSMIPGVKVVTTFRTGDKRKAEISANKIKELAKKKILMPGHTV